VGAERREIRIFRQINHNTFPQLQCEDLDTKSNTIDILDDVRHNIIID